MSWAYIAVAGTAATIKGGTAAYQYFDAKKQLKELGDATEYQIPQEAKDQLTEDQSKIVEGLPAESKRMFVDNMLSGQAGGLQQMGERKGGFIGLAGQQQTATQGMNALLAQDVNIRQQNEMLKQQQLARSRDEMISQAETVYQEKSAEYWDKYNEIKGEKGASRQNVYSAANDMTSAGAMAAGQSGGFGGGQQAPPQQQGAGGLSNYTSPNYQAVPQSGFGSGANQNRFGSNQPLNSGFTGGLNYNSSFNNRPNTFDPNARFY